MREDKILYNYRKQVDELLDDQSGKYSLSELNQEELNEIWQEISTEMDIGEVWDYISSDLDIEMPLNSGSGMIIKSIALVLVILMGVIPGEKSIPDSGNNQADILFETWQNEQPAELIFRNDRRNSGKENQVKKDISPVFRSPSDKSEDLIIPVTEIKEKTSIMQETSIPVSDVIVSQVISASKMSDSNLPISTDRTPIEKFNIPPGLFSDHQENIYVPSGKDLDSLKINDHSLTSGFPLPLINRGRISVGLITLYKNTWLLNQETWDGFKSESLHSTEIVFFPDVGLNLNYSFNNNWLLQAEGYFYSNTGQEYFEYIYGHYAKKIITLRYSTIALSVKYKITGRNGYLQRSSINLLAGGYLSVLHNADQTINTEIENIRSQYEKFDLGVRLGSEIELHISDHLSLAPGLIMSLGIPNIYKGDNNIPGYLRRTHNGSAGFHLTFYYHFD